MLIKSMKLVLLLQTFAKYLALKITNKDAYAQ